MSDALPSAVTEVLAHELGAAIRSAHPVGGGCIGAAHRVELDDGRRVFVKLYDGGDDMVEAEAHGLRWLDGARAIRVPAVLAVGDAQTPHLALEWIETSRPSPDFDARLGRQLAALHRAGAPSFGLERDNYIGTLPQSNATRADWPTFFRTQRLEPMIERADALLDVALRRAFERLHARLHDLCGPPEPPARLHGDLWSGNLMVDEHGAPTVIDPAVYGGHREIDLAMMKLFGGFGAQVFSAYDEAHPLAPGWRDRVPLYQLYPLLVHVNLFGSGYLGQLAQALGRYV
jgi:fructosamine-3-kinase